MLDKRGSIRRLTSLIKTGDFKGALGGVLQRIACHFKEELPMKTWTKPAVREQEVGLEVTSYLPAEIDII